MKNTIDTWHAAYCRWYDHREAGHRARAAAWGRVADLLVALMKRETGR